MLADKAVKTEAIVLGSFKYGEADLIVTFFGRNTGKVRAIAKGARRAKSKMRGSLQLFNRGDYLLYKGKSLYTLTQCESKEPFVVLRQDLSKFAYASYCAEIVREILPEEELNLDAYTLLLNIFKIMSVNQEQLAARLFDLHMLKISGYFPELSCCINCGNPLSGKAVFSPLEGGMVCCGGVSGITVGKDTAAVMHHLAEMDISKAYRLKPSPRNLDEMERVTKAYWEYILEKRLHSVEFIEKIRRFA